MSAVFIAVAVLLVLLIGFVLLILRSLAATAGVRIRADMLRVLASYDKLIADKTRELDTLKAKEERRRKPLKISTDGIQRMVESSASPGGVPAFAVPPAANYRPHTFGGSYGALRDQFRVDARERSIIIEQVEQALPAQLPGRGEAAAALQEQLSFDTVFLLSRLMPDEQLEILDISLHDDQWPLLRDFHDELLGAPFDVTRFYDWLGERAVLEANALSVRCGDVSVSRVQDVAFRPEICEGVQIVAGNILYDFSMREREIN